MSLAYQYIKTESASMPSQKNQQQVQVIKDKLDQAKSVVVFDYSGTTANDQVELRSSVKEAGGEVIVTKNRLVDVAVGTGKLTESLEGMNAFLFSYEDAVSAVKKLFEFHDDTEKLTIKQGVMDDKILSASEVEALSKLPSRDELLAKLVYVVKAPSTGLVNVLKAGQRDLVGVLKAISQKEA